MDLHNGNPTDVDFPEPKSLYEPGWYLRQDIIWSKSNPMPESVRDRCTKAHEYIFLLSKSERYWYDAEAINEVSVKGVETREASGVPSGDRDDRGIGRYTAASKFGGDGTRNRRSVWTITTQPYPNAHFATFPPELPELCIRAGCPPRVCRHCGKPWLKNLAESAHKAGLPDHIGLPNIGCPNCWCDDDATPGTVLDPFGGAGTTGLVADRLGRDAVLIELNPAYAGMAERRIHGDAPLFAQVAAE
jgi:DNA modification methylase